MRPSLYCPEITLPAIAKETTIQLVLISAALSLTKLIGSTLFNWAPYVLWWILTEALAALLMTFYFLAELSENWRKKKLTKVRRSQLYLTERVTTKSHVAYAFSFLKSMSEPYLEALTSGSGSVGG